MKDTIEVLYIDQRQASKRYCLSTKWFERSRWLGDGPEYIKVNRKVLYPLKHTDAWFAKHRMMTSTSLADSVQMSGDEKNNRELN